MSSWFLRGASAFLIVLFSSANAMADISILVAPKKSDAYTNAKALADKKTIFAERRIHKAFNRAAKHLKKCQTCTATIKVAAGEYTGRGGGGFVFPDIKVPKAKLHILGGWNDSFDQRSPFETPTVLASAQARSTAVIGFAGKRHAIGEVVISGFTIDVAAGNRYDKKSNSLMKGTSSSRPILAFGYLTTNRLVIADNVFMNAANGVAQPLIRAMTDDAEVIVRNNFFLNNIHTWVVSSASFRHIPARYVLEGNSFVLNWPYNPDPTTANPGTLEIGNKYSAKQVEITGNLFAYNVGGAIFPQYDDDRGPPLTIKNNLFFHDGALFSAEPPGGGALVGKFFGSGVHKVFDHETAEDEFDWEMEDNDAFDPDVPVAKLKLKAVSYGKEHTTGLEKPEVAKPEEEAAEPESDPADASIDDLLADLKSLDDQPIEMEEDFSMEEMADDGSIKNYAPRMPYNPRALPFPGNSDANAYGASSDRVSNP